MATRTAPKHADIRYRVELKQSRLHIVVYKVRSSDDSQDYDVTLVDGKVNNCTCKSLKPCYHMRDYQAREDARRQAEQAQGMNELAAEMAAERERRETAPLESASSRGFSLLRR